MFTSHSKDQITPGSTETFIGPSVKLEGNFAGDGDVVVEGILIGNLATKGSIKVGQNAIIEAEVVAQNAQIAGKVKGNLTISEKLSLASTAVILGDVRALVLEVQEGAIVNGKLTMSKEKPSQQHSQQRQNGDKAKSLDQEA